MTRFSPPSQLHGGYIFDCDGTLVDSMALHHRAWREALAPHGAPFDFDWALFMKRAGVPVAETVRQLNSEFACALPDDRIAAAQHAVYERELASLQPIPEVVNWARQLRGRAPLAVASGGVRDTVLRSLEVIGVRDWFDPIVTATDVARSKPHPEMMLVCARAMGVEPADCLVIEDGQAGIDAAVAAGMSWVRVASPEHPRAATGL